ncbi:MAG: hypothetical protein V1913_16230 [Fibrobacterota bacterium]
MKKYLVFTLLAVFSTGLLSSGWARKANVEEMTKLQEQVQAAETAEKKLADLTAQKADLESQLEAKKQELKKTEEELSAVKAKVGQ